MVSFGPDAFDSVDGVGLRYEQFPGQGHRGRLTRSNLDLPKPITALSPTSLTGLDWYVRPNADNNWYEAKAWVDGLTVAGGGWRMPTVPELKGIYQKGASRVNMDPLFEPKSAWVWSGQMDDARTYYGFAFYSGLVNSHSMHYGLGRMAFAVRSHK